MLYELSWLYLLFFFFSSRRRHTRLVSDWSSDVCSSDLDGGAREQPGGQHAQWDDDRRGGERGRHVRRFEPQQDGHGLRSEERRVGKSVDLGGRRIIKKKKERERRRHRT